MKPRYSVARCCCDGGPAMTDFEFGDSGSWNTGGVGVLAPPSYSGYAGTVIGVKNAAVVGFTNTTFDVGVRAFSAWMRVELAIPAGSTILAANLYTAEQYGMGSTQLEPINPPPVQIVDESHIFIDGLANHDNPGIPADPADAVRMLIRAEDIDDAPASYGTETAYDSAARKSASKALTIPYRQYVGSKESPRVIGDEITYPDITAVIQEVISRPGWTSGNHLRIFFDENGSDSNLFPPTTSYGSCHWFGNRPATAFPPLLPLLQVAWS